MATIKAHAFKSEDDADPKVLGLDTVDFRDQDETAGIWVKEKHKTIFELEFGPDVETNDLIEGVLRDGPAYNRLNATLIEAGFKPSGIIAEALEFADADNFGVRIGVWPH